MAGIIKLTRMGGRARGRGVRRQSGVMNGTEKEYAGLLLAKQRAGEIAEFFFDCLKLRIAENCFYTPDFMVMLPDGEIEIHEVKGFWEDDARVKIKVAADKFPFQFVAVQKISKKDGGGWKEERF